MKHKTPSTGVPAPSTARPYLLALALTCSMLAATGCTPPPSNEDALQDLMRLKAPDLHLTPITPESWRLFDNITTAARQTYNASSPEEARKALIAEHGQDQWGLFTLALWLEKLAKDDPRQAKALCTEIMNTFKDLPIAAMALDKLLTTIPGTPADHIACCETILEDPAAPQRLRSLALQRRMERYRDLGDYKHAALDALNYWASFPDRVEMLQLKLALLGILEYAGLLLEAQMLTQSTEPGKTAKLLDADFSQAGAWAALEGHTPPAHATTAWYLCNAPSIEAPQIPEGNAPPTTAQLLMLARTIFAAIHAKDPAATRQAATTYAKAIEDITQAPAEQDYIEWADLLAHVMSRYIHNNIRIMSTSQIASSGQRNNLLNATNEAAKQIENAHIAFIWHATAGETDEKRAAQAVEKIIQFSETTCSIKAPRDAYERFLTLFPNAPAAPRFALRLARYQKTPMNSPVRAVEQYTHLTLTYPQSPESQDALLEGGNTLMELRRYEDAYLLVQKAAATFEPGSEKQLEARMKTALCQWAMGLKDEALQNLTTLAAQYPKSDIAPLALFSAGQKHLEEQHYVEARQHFQDVAEYYPHSPEAFRSRDYLKHLDRMPKK